MESTQVNHVTRISRVDQLLPHTGKNFQTVQREERKALIIAIVAGVGGGGAEPIETPAKKIAIIFIL